MQEVSPTRSVPLELSVLGELRVSRDGREVSLPPSRKTRALLAYLVLTGRSHRRERLCELFWDVTDDPRGALRWSLSKLRALVDDAGERRIQADREHVAFRADGSVVDVLRLRRELGQASLDEVAIERLEGWAASFRGDLLEGLDLADFHEYQAWCVAEREQARKLRSLILGTLCRRLDSSPERLLPQARTWVRVDPSCCDARIALMRAAAATGRRDEAEQHHDVGRRILSELDAGEAARLTEAFRLIGSGSEPAPNARRPAAAPRSEVAPVSRLAPPSAEPASMVGRDPEKRLLRKLFDEVVSQRREQLLLLLGEPGIGKSTLLSALRNAAGLRGATVISGAAFEWESGRPYGPFIDALRALAQSGGTSTEGLAPLLPELGDETGSQLTRERLFSAVSAVVRAAAESGPVVIVLDDVQWLDRASAELLHYVARNGLKLPLFLVLSARGEELSDNVVAWKVLRALKRDRIVTEHQLMPLDPQAVGELIEGVGAGMSPERLHQQSGGNPLFALELLRGQSGDAEALPESVAEAVRDRVERLAASAHDVLRWAAVYGGPFSGEVLEPLVDAESAALVSALEALTRYALIRPDGDAGYRFSHEVVRRAVYADISEPRRRLMHRRVAEALSRRHDPDGSRVADVAHHAALGHAHDLAALACRTAGQRCVKMFANQQALSLARRGLRHAERLQETERVRRSVELLEVMLAAAPPDDPKIVARQLEELGERALDLGCAEHARLAFFLIGFVTWEGGDWEAARRRMHQAEVASRSEDPSTRVGALAAAGRCLVMLERDLPQAHAMLLEAEARAKVIDVVPVALLDGLGMIAAHRGEQDKALSLLRRAGELASAKRDRIHEFTALEHVATLELDRDNYAAAGETGAQLVLIGERMREGSEAPFARAVASLAAYGSGEGGEPELSEALAALRVADAKHRLAYALTHAALIDLRRGEPARARERAVEALPIARLLERHSETLLSLIVLARAARDLRDADGLREALDQIAEGDWSSAAFSVRARHRELLSEPLPERTAPPAIESFGASRLAGLGTDCAKGDSPARAPEL